MRPRPEKFMDLETVPAVVVATRDGTVVSQNTPARRLMGEGTGKPCWEVVGGLGNAEALPCGQGCVNWVITRGPNQTQHTDIKLAGRRHHLTCIPVDELAVCTLRAEGEQQPKKWEVLTAREQEILELLAAGEITSSMAERLEIRESTVRTHVEKMRDKFGVSTRAALVALGFRLGYLDNVG
ncbi:MAG: helix-turn-helix transcriptional regulator [Myxococcota bacterium]|nr:helix-turn-helix transcriptional regulator [bacterium]MDP6242261.1 helix-turn-helix transcriptional regulator [Myxococcota bacterium]MDP7074422.1 helix-turn-helix transcriptional regulator [Myxococcota bacterium]MDP7434175.1 helix-turn-helix transcriptional regulator [Myxococcota bacterium]HJO25397.1 helix-turn-helix transcriptional regulator [Myxococcota bacterium]